MNNKNISFKTTNYTFLLCTSFIEDTKFDVVHKDDPDLKYLISDVIHEAITIQECYSYNILPVIPYKYIVILSVINNTTQSYVNNESFMMNVYKRISFFSDCYEKNFHCTDIRKISHCTFCMDMDMKIFSINNILYLWIFFSLKDILELDENIIRIVPHYYNYVSERKQTKSFQYIIERLYESLLQLYKELNPTMKTKSSTEGSYQMLLEIGTRINNNKKNFVINLRNYDEFNYFVNKHNNPQKGYLTRLRFL